MNDIAPKLGRPTKFNESLCEKILELAESGKTTEQIAEIVGVTARTLYNWQANRPEFFQSLKESRQVADELVEASLFSRAVGYSHEDEKVFCQDGQIIVHRTVKQYPPDTAAAIFWLKNRQPDQWRDKTEVDATVGLADWFVQAKLKRKAENGG